MTPNAPRVTDSKNTRDTPQLLSIEYDSPNKALMAPGHQVAALEDLAEFGLLLHDERARGDVDHETPPAT
jgi:hypothetical protein